MVRLSVGTAELRTRREVGKAIACAFAALCASVLVLTLLARPVLAASFEMPKTDIDATLDSSGSLEVVEQRTFDFSGNVNGVYWNLPSGEYKGRSVTTQVESVGEYGTDGTLKEYSKSTSRSDGSYEVSTTDGKMKLKLYSAHSGGTATYAIRYRIKGIATKWADTGELNWQFVSKNWDAESKNVTCTIHLPVPDGQSVTAGDNVRVWGHGPLDASVSVSGNDVVYKVPGVGTSEYAEARIVFPKEWLSAATSNVSSENQLDAILSEEQTWAGQANAERMKARAITGGAVGIPGLVAIVGLVLWLRARRDVKRRKEKLFSDTYFRDVPTDDHPAVLGALLHDCEASPNELTATLMMLTDTKVISLEHVKEEKKGLFGGETEDYVLRRSEVPYPHADKDDWHSIDQGALEFVFETVHGYGYESEDGSVRFAEFKKAAKDYSEKYKEAFDAWAGTVTEVCGSKGYCGEPPTSGGVLMSVLAIAMVLYIIAMVVAVLWFELSLLVAVGGVAVAILGLVFLAKGLTATPSLSDEGLEVVAKLEALKRWLTDFTRLDEAVPQDVVLWNRLLVMAVVLDVSEDVIEQLKVAAPQVVEDMEAGPTYWWYAAAWRGHYRDSGVGMLAPAVHEASTEAIAGSSDSSGDGLGGGFSFGGGDGFGGDGGGIF